jgi:hypothetical protein
MRWHEPHVCGTDNTELTFLDSRLLFTKPAGPYESLSPHSMYVLVMMTTDSRGMLYVFKNLPRIRSEEPWEYVSAVSKVYASVAGVRRSGAALSCSR